MNGCKARSWWLAGLIGLGLVVNNGCQTYFVETGQTLPTGHYLEHPPQFFPPTPPFPLVKEQFNLEMAVRNPSEVPRPLLPQGGAPMLPPPGGPVMPPPPQ